MKKVPAKRWEVASSNSRFRRFVLNDGSEHNVLKEKLRNDPVIEWVAYNTGCKFVYISPLKLIWTAWKPIAVVQELYVTEFVLKDCELKAEIIVRDGPRYFAEVCAIYANDSLSVVAHQAFGTWDEAITWCDVIATVSNPYELACSLEMGGHK